MPRKYFRVPFATWLRQFRHEKSDRGTLARVVKLDEMFPIYKSKIGMKNYMMNNGVSPEILVIFEKIWTEFETYDNAKTTTGVQQLRAARQYVECEIDPI